ncbi:hypothetical protein tb265_10100 [Gemmatimonadetes bacterium T265]|nr:hypothetical protein tb265_10100 [Gemmatimonadetes bacterium T265]
MHTVHGAACGRTTCNPGRGARVRRGMQTPTPAPAPAVPPAPAAPAIPGAVPQALPRTGDELAALRHRRSEISDQLSSVQHRRDQLARELRQPMGPAGGADRTGIEQRLAVLDGRIVGLENDLNTTGQLIAAAPASALASGVDGMTSPYGHAFRAGAGVGFGVSAVLALLYARLRRAGRRRDARAPVAAGADSARLARVEQAVEAVAIEVERISEGQRFVTQLLAERRDEARLGEAAR